MQEDRGLWLILGGVGGLIVLALAVFFLRPEPKYVDDSTPQGVAQNYLLAMYRGDFERAYGYLADEKNKPAFVDFVEAMRLSREEIRRVSARLGDTNVVGDQAIVEVFFYYSGRGLFDGGWSSPDAIRLVRQADGWKIRSAPYPFWQWFPLPPPPYGD